MTPAGMAGKGGSGTDGGGDGNEATDADLRRFEVNELERGWVSSNGD